MSNELRAYERQAGYQIARGDIEGLCMPKRIGESDWFWFDTRADGHDRPHVDAAVRYLEARGLLERNPEDGCMVRVREPADREGA